MEEHRCSSISANGTYHRTYDPCIPKFLKQAGVKTDFVRLEDVGIRGNSHMMMLEKNSDEVIKFITGWLQKNVLARGRLVDEVTPTQCELEGATCGELLGVGLRLGIDIKELGIRERVLR